MNYILIVKVKAQGTLKDKYKINNEIRVTSAENESGTKNFKCSIHFFLNKCYTFQNPRKIMMSKFKILYMNICNINKYCKSQWGVTVQSFSPHAPEFQPKT